MIKIEFQCEPHEMAAHMAAMGYHPKMLWPIGQEPAASGPSLGVRNAADYAVPTPKTDAVDESLRASYARETTAVVADRAAPESVETESTPTPEEDAHETGQDANPNPTDNSEPRHANGRVVGMPGEGRKRRSRAEIDEDEAWYATPQALKENAAKIVALTTHPAAPDDKPLISTGAERINPEDAADEKAETKDVVDPHTQLRAVIAEFREKRGMAEAQRVIPKILGAGGVPEIKAEDVPAKIAAIRAEIAAKIETTVSPVRAEINDVKEAIRQYAKKYDGSTEQHDMAVTVIDVPKLLERTFGAGINRPAAIPASPENYGKALTAINEAITSNPYNREVKK